MTVAMMMMAMVVKDRGGSGGRAERDRLVHQQPTMMEMTRYRRQDTHQCSDYQHERRRDDVAARTHYKQKSIESLSICIVVEFTRRARPYRAVFRVVRREYERLSFQRRSDYLKSGRFRRVSD